ncbi:hypothetical protein PFISCL1PPCAC_25959, partial [Pristionchus fissidentatus]
QRRKYLSVNIRDHRNTTRNVFNKHGFVLEYLHGFVDNLQNVIRVEIDPKTNDRLFCENLSEQGSVLGLLLFSGGACHDSWWRLNQILEKGVEELVLIRLGRIWLGGIGCNSLSPMVHFGVICHCMLQFF